MTLARTALAALHQLADEVGFHRPQKPELHAKTAGFVPAHDAGEPELLLRAGNNAYHRELRPKGRLHGRIQIHAADADVLGVRFEARRTRLLARERGVDGNSRVLAFDFQAQTSKRIPMTKSGLVPTLQRILGAVKQRRSTKTPHRPRRLFEGAGAVSIGVVLVLLSASLAAPRATQPLVLPLPEPHHAVLAREEGQRGRTPHGQ